MARQKKRGAPRAPFIVTITAASAVALAALPGCGEATSNPPGPSDAGCPEEEPSGGDCGQEGLGCSYGQNACGQASQYECVEGGWVHLTPTPPCDCPAVLPRHGDPCVPTVVPSCIYPIDTGCGSTERPATCVDNAWDTTAGICNPPPP